jgi:hypothetical protein
MSRDTIISQTLNFTYLATVLNQPLQQARLEAFAGHLSILPHNQVLLVEPNQPATVLIRIPRHNGLWREPPRCPSCFTSSQSQLSPDEALSQLFDRRLEAQIKVNRTGIRYVRFDCLSCSRHWYADKEPWWSLEIEGSGWQRQHWIVPYPFGDWVLVPPQNKS